MPEHQSSEQVGGWKDDDHVWVSRWLRSWRSRLPEILEHISAVAEGLNDPSLNAAMDSDGEPGLVVYGYCLATPQEKAEEHRRLTVRWKILRAEQELLAVKLGEQP